MGSSSAVARVVSFAFLLAIVIVIGVVFFQVMAIFLVPVFVAVVFAIVFQPVHDWFIIRCRGRNRLSAALTTGSILLIVLVPTAIAVSQAIAEGWGLVKNITRESVNRQIAVLRYEFKLYLPPAAIRDELSRFERGLERLTRPVPGDPPINVKQTLGDLDTIALHLDEWLAEGDWPPRSAAQQPSLIDAKAVDELKTAIGELRAAIRGVPATDETTAVGVASSMPPVQHAFHTVREILIGTPLTERLRALANPGDEEIAALRSWLGEHLAPAAAETLPRLVSVLVGLVIFIPTLYFALADGSRMLRTMIRLSPLDERHVQQLLTEFGKVSRAVVAATLLTALAQGILAGIGFKLAGVGAVFLLSVLTMVASMIPFFGAAFVWVPVSGWLFLNGHYVAGTGLAIYGTVVISLVDNLVKPWVLHGQSNLHPLLALLSVLGGVTALGPIGVFVGPMAVVFLQVVLQMLQAEMANLSERGGWPWLRAAVDETTPKPPQTAPLPGQQPSGEKPAAAESTPSVSGQPE